MSARRLKSVPDPTLALILAQCPHGITRHFCAPCRALETILPGPRGRWDVTAKAQLCPWCQTLMEAEETVYYRETLEGHMYVCEYCADELDDGGDDLA